MAGTISFRSITDDDRVFLQHLYSSTRHDELSVLDWSDEEKRSFLEMQFDAQHSYYQRTFPEARFDLILEDGQPIGRLYADTRTDEIRLIDIALLPERRGDGIGSQLMHDLLEEARHQAKVLRIHVERYNPALRLYLRLGFDRIEDQGVYYLMEWRPDSLDDQPPAPASGQDA